MEVINKITRMLGEGKSSGEIAAEMGLKKTAVYNYIYHHKLRKKVKKLQARDAYGAQSGNVMRGTGGSNAALFRKNDEAHKVAFGENL